ncbi:hypothetical protein CNE_BB2p00610 (plasmid) [Cupriavidus necator N-1]|uniref:Uncharacterized protein n=1 Tax=Cupriavidus necator (strain ATCC 43291 / DSM 13513 / CCUG 52238 / LMG 8453 / N-1) TaxID=1042878 RepID=F8GYD4_CUPNN|nr:hypothetical protein CNE_BB2p00610 [Cupriavidus necator N-1]
MAGGASVLIQTLLVCLARGSDLDLSSEIQGIRFGRSVVMILELIFMKGEIQLADLKDQLT